MPIYGLTDETPSFKEIARIYKGEERKRGQVEPGKPLPYFRIKFKDGEDAAKSRFLEIYGGKPDRIHFRLPFPEIERCWDAYLEAYLKGGLIGRSDGRKWISLLDYESDEWVVRNGELTEAGVDRGISLQYNPDIPVTKWTDKTGKEWPVYAKPYARMRIVIPELRRLAYVTVITSSSNDIREISRELGGIKLWAEQELSVPITKIPLILTKREQEFTYPTDGGRATRRGYFIHVEPDPKWASVALDFMKVQSMLPFDVPDLDLPELPEGMHAGVEHSDEADGFGDFVDSEIAPELPDLKNDEGDIPLDDSDTNGKPQYHSVAHSGAVEFLKAKKEADETVYWGFVYGMGFVHQDGMDMIHRTSDGVEDWTASLLTATQTFSKRSKDV